MPVLRILGLICLTLVATTLPATARPFAPRPEPDAPAAQRAESAAQSVTTDAEPADEDGQKDQDRLLPITDLWDGGAGRTLQLSSAPTLLAALLARMPVIGQLAPAIHERPDRPQASPRPGSERHWLAARDAHAPPRPESLRALH